MVEWAAAMALVALLVAAAHWPVLSAGALSFDDDMYLVDNPVVRQPGWSSAGRFLREVAAPSTVAGYYQPLAMISIMLDCAAGGRPDDLRPFHRTSLVLHVANVCLVGLLLFTLFGSPWPAAVTALLYGVHPLTVESVAWIAERKTLLATFFALACLILYVRYSRRGGRAGYLAALVAFALSLMSKPTGTLLPVVLLLLDVWPLGRLSRRTLIEKAPFFALCAVSAVITYVSQSRTAGAFLPGDTSAFRAPLLICHNIVFYPYKLLLPINLSSHYAMPEPLDLSHPMVRAGVIGTVLLLAGLFVSTRWTPVPLVGWLCFFVLIFPTLGVIGFTHVIAADKYVYLPVIGFLLILSHYLNRLWSLAQRSARRVPVALAAVGIVAVLVGMEMSATRSYLRNWRSTESLARHMMAVEPDGIVPLNMLGVSLRLNGRNEAALEVLTRAAQRDPRDERARLNLAGVLFDLNRPDEALAHAREAVALAPQSAKALNILGITLVRLGQSDEGVACLFRAIERAPEWAEAYCNLGICWAMIGRPSEAAACFERALALRPDFREAHNNLARLLAQSSRFDESIDRYRKMLSMWPEYADARANLGLVLLHVGRREEAVIEFQTVLAADPKHPQAVAGLALVLKAIQVPEPIAATRPAAPG